MMIRTGWRYWKRTYHRPYTLCMYIRWSPSILTRYNTNGNVFNNRSKKTQGQEEATPLTESNDHSKIKIKPQTNSSEEDSPIEDHAFNENASQTTTSWRERAKNFAVEYGPVGIVTHTVLSLISFSAIYIGVSSGVDVESLLHSLGFSSTEHHGTANSAGTFVLAYTVYKLASPIRWPLTFAVTPIVARVLRKRGYMAAKTTTPNTRGRNDSSSD